MYTHTPTPTHNYLHPCTTMYTTTNSHPLQWASGSLGVWAVAVCGWGHLVFEASCRNEIEITVPGSKVVDSLV